MSERESAARRPNPARVAERIAVAVVGEWARPLGGAVRYIGDGTAAGRDFAIDYPDGHHGVGEVKVDADELIEATRSATERMLGGEPLPLPEGLGVWWVQLDPRARIDILAAALPRLLAMIVGSGDDRLSVFGDYPHTPAGDLARTLGVEHARRVGSEDPSRVLCVFAGPAGWFGEPNAAVDFVERVADRFREGVERLAALAADERHAVLVAYTGTPHSEHEQVRRIVDTPPTRDPVIDERITHVWVFASPGPTGVGLWVRGAEWTALPWRPEYVAES